MTREGRNRHSEKFLALCWAMKSRRGGGGVGRARGTLAVCQLRADCVLNPERALKLGSRKLGLHEKVCWPQQVVQ